MVNVKRLGTTALSAAGDDSESLRLMLESKAIAKVGFDIRGMSKLLFRQLNVSLDGMYDLQLMEFASRDDGQSKKFLAGLAKCIDQDIPDTNTAKRRWLQPDNSTNLHLFNSPGHVPRQSMKRVELFPALWKVYRRKLGPPSKAFWLRFARVKSWQRVQDSKKDLGRGNRQDLGPEFWWDPEQREAALDDWLDELVMESNVGDWELNGDAEWVPTRNAEDWDVDSS